jgi:hypothetical protein
MAFTPGKGTLLQLSISSVFTTISQRVQVTPPDMENPRQDTTNLDNTWRTNRSTIPDGGTVGMIIQYDAAAVTHAALWTSFVAGTTEDWKIVFTDTGAAEIPWSGHIEKFTFGEADVDNLILATLAITVSGAVTITP